jgi:hypothetical protein
VDIATLPQPGQADDGAFGVLTQNGKLVVYYYSIIDSKQSYMKFLTASRKSDEKAAKGTDKEVLTKEEKLARSNEDKAEASTFKKPFMVTRLVDSIDLPEKITEKFTHLS